MKYFCEHILAASTANLSAINRKTTQRIYSLLRDRIVELAIQEARPFVGCVEVDESYLEPNEFVVNAGVESVEKRRSLVCTDGKEEFL